MLFPCIVTSATWPRLTSLRKSEKARVACGPRLEEVWNRLKSATRSSPITIQRARFLPKLFTSKPFPCRAGHRGSINPTPTRDRLATIFARFTDKRQWQLNNYEARLGQRIDGAKNKMRSGADSIPRITHVGNGYDVIVVPRCWQGRGG